MAVMPASRPERTWETAAFPSSGRLVRRSAIVAVAIALAAPGVASAHTGGPISTDFEARIGGLRPRWTACRRTCWRAT